MCIIEIMDESVRKIAHDVAYQGDKSSIGQLVVTSLRIKWLDSSEIPRFEAAYASLKKCVINKATDVNIITKETLNSSLKKKGKLLFALFCFCTFFICKCTFN